MALKAFRLELHCSSKCPSSQSPHMWHRSDVFLISVSKKASWSCISFFFFFLFFFIPSGPYVTHGAKSDPQGKWPTCDLHLNSPIIICQRYHDNKSFLHHSLEAPGTLFGSLAEPTLKTRRTIFQKSKAFEIIFRVTPSSLCKHYKFRIYNSYSVSPHSNSLPAFTLSAP